VLAVYVHISLIEGRPRTEGAMRKAAELDSTLTESHFSLGFATCVFGSRLAEAERHYCRALLIPAQPSVTHAQLIEPFVNSERNLVARHKVYLAFPM
jgi:hypothetical protein